MGPLVILGVVLVVAVGASAVIGRSSILRLRVAGAILAGLGLVLLGTQTPPTPERLGFGLAMLAAWGGVGLALVAGRTWARLPGLALAAVGLVAASWIWWRVEPWANEIGPPEDRILVDVFYLADGPLFSWIEVSVTALVFFVLSALAGALLVWYRAPAHGPGSGS